MIYTVLKNNGWGDFHWEGEFNSLREARAYCKTMTSCKEKVQDSPDQQRSKFCFEIYRGEVAVDGEEAYPIDGTDWYYV